MVPSSNDKGDTYFVGIDVGTGSARAGVFDAGGRRRAVASKEIRMWRPQTDYVEQSSEDIWNACAGAVREALSVSGISPNQVGGIGFDATCSLVVLDDADRPITASPTGRDEQNVIVWMDHRAVEQASRINEQGHEVLKYVGGVISPEMQIPKLLWLKENLPQTWKRAARFFDLPDFLSFRATGADVRSLCTTVCKWTYLGHEKGGSPDGIGRWDVGFFRRVDLDDLVEEGFRRIGTRVRPMGEAAGEGLTAAAAKDFGLPAGTPVAVSLIDAHAGGVGSLAVGFGEGGDGDFERRLALIGGTSSCHMAVSPEPRFIPGIWGPYYSAMIPELWLTEGGQSATGALVDHIVANHGASPELFGLAEREGRSVYEILNQRLESLAEGEPFAAALTRDVHVCPYFHGNRSPRADPTLKGMISGLSLSRTLDDLAVLYLATIQAIAYGTRHIIEEMNRAGYRIDTIVACGGGTKNPVFLREHADIAGCRILLTEESEAVLLGAAILGGVAGGHFDSIPRAMASMTRDGRRIEPAGDPVCSYHNSKYNVFLRMYDHQVEYRKLVR